MIKDTLKQMATNALWLTEEYIKLQERIKALETRADNLEGRTEALLRLIELNPQLNRVKPVGRG